MKYRIMLNTGFSMAPVAEYETSAELEELLAEKAPLHIESGQSALFALPRLADSMETLTGLQAINVGAAPEGELSQQVHDLARLMSMVAKNHAGVIEFVRVV